MAPSFDTLSDHDFEDGEEELDFSDLRDQYEVRMEEGLDTFVVCERGAIVPQWLMNSGDRWTPRSRPRSKTQIDQISDEKTYFCGTIERSRRCLSVHAYR